MVQKKCLEIYCVAIGVNRVQQCYSRIVVKDLREKISTRLKIGFSSTVNLNFDKIAGFLTRSTNIKHLQYIFKVYVRVTRWKSNVTTLSPQCWTEEEPCIQFIQENLIENSIQDLSTLYTKSIWSMLCLSSLP